MKFELNYSTRCVYNNFHIPMDAAVLLVLGVLGITVGVSVVCAVDDEYVMGVTVEAVDIALLVEETASVEDAVDHVEPGCRLLAAVVTSAVVTGVEAVKGDTDEEGSADDEVGMKEVFDVGVGGKEDVGSVAIEVSAVGKVELLGLVV